MGTHVVKH